jgi:hypothetical protein
MAIDYEKLIKEFGTRKIDQPLLDRFEKLTGRKPHMLLRRGVFFSHRSVTKQPVCSAIEDLMGLQGIRLNPRLVREGQAVLSLYRSRAVEQQHALGPHPALRVHRVGPYFMLRPL